VKERISTVLGTPVEPVPATRVLQNAPHKIPPTADQRGAQNAGSRADHLTGTEGLRLEVEAHDYSELGIKAVIGFGFADRLDSGGDLVLE
jgi:hypothetical protein